MMHNEPWRPYAGVNSGSAARLRMWLCASISTAVRPGQPAGVVRVGRLDRDVVPALVQRREGRLDQAAEPQPTPDPRPRAGDAPRHPGGRPGPPPGPVPHRAPPPLPPPPAVPPHGGAGL